MGLLKGAEVRHMVGVTRLTLYRYVKAGKLTPVKFNSKIYLYDEEQIYRLLGQSIPTGSGIAIYARVNSHAQKAELNEQIRRVTEFAGKNGMTVQKTYYDCTKSLDFSRSTRKGLHELMHDVTKRRIGLVVVESPDRIAQIGHELLQMMFSSYRVRILYMQKEPVNMKYLSETTKELASIVRGLRNMIDHKKTSDTGGSFGN